MYAVLLLIQRGANRDHRDNEGRTALHWAAAFMPSIMRPDQEKIAMRLLNSMNGASLLANDEHGRRAYDVALQTEEEERKRLAELDAMPEIVAKLLRSTMRSNTRSELPLSRSIQLRCKIIKCQVVGGRSTGGSGSECG